MKNTNNHKRFDYHQLHIHFGNVTMLPRQAARVVCLWGGVCARTKKTHMQQQKEKEKSTSLLP